jgi:type I restriction enzyme M protein
MVDRTRCEFSEEDIARIASTYDAWRGEKDTGEYQDIPGFCKAAKLEEIKGHNYILTPGRYVGAADIEEDDAPFSGRFAELNSRMETQFAESAKLAEEIRKKLAGVIL